MVSLTICFICLRHFIHASPLSPTVYPLATAHHHTSHCQKSLAIGSWYIPACHAELARCVDSEILLILCVNRHARLPKTGSACSIPVSCIIPAFGKPSTRHIVGLDRHEINMRSNGADQP
jgi:hypothetical protein